MQITVTLEDLVPHLGNLDREALTALVASATGILAGRLTLIEARADHEFNGVALKRGFMGTALKVVCAVQPASEGVSGGAGSLP